MADVAASGRLSGAECEVRFPKGHNYYHCGKRRGPCPTKTIREEALAELLRESIRRVSIPDDWADKILAIGCATCLPRVGYELHERF